MRSETKARNIKNPAIKPIDRWIKKSTGSLCQRKTSSGHSQNELDDIEDDALLLIDNESYLHRMHIDKTKGIHIMTYGWHFEERTVSKSDIEFKLVGY